VQKFNANLRELSTTMDQRIEVGRQAKKVEQENGSHSLAAIEQHGALAKLEVTTAELQEKGARLRDNLRTYRLVRAETPGSGPVFYLPGDVPSGIKHGHPSWWLKVRNTPLRESALTLIGGGAVVGSIPKGLPRIAAPRFDWSIMVELFPMAIIISLLGFMEAISIAKAMANRTGQRLDPNQELIGQGIANIVGSFTQSYPVSGSFSRSAVNIQAGAATGMSSVFSSLVVLITLLFLTPLLYYLPQAVLAAIIMMAVVGLINVKGVVHAWQAQRYDGIIAVISFVCTLAFAPHLDKGIIIGVLLSLGLFLLRNMRPPTAILSRTPDGHYRSAERWGLQTCQHMAVFRFNCSLIFANVNHLEVELLKEIGARPGIKHVLFVGNGVNELDSSGEVMLSYLVSKLRAAGIDVSFSGLNDHVIDVMKRTHLYEKVAEDHFYKSVHQAVDRIHRGACLQYGGEGCPLLTSQPRHAENPDGERRQVTKPGASA
jgi:SulP family sulfate permease